MFKKIIPGFILICVLVISTITPISAYSSSNYAGGDISEYVSLEEQRDQLLSNPNLTSEQRSKIIDKYEKAVQAMNNTISVRSMARDTITAKRLHVPFCEQINNYYCGPATTQQTYYYLNNEFYGSYAAPTQQTIAQAVGTTTSGTNLENMKNYLNSEFTQDYYVQWWWGSVDTMVDSVYQAICDDNRPTILHISIENIAGTGWKFRTDGHFVSVVGYNSTCTEFNIIDPYKDGHGISTGAYTVSDDDIFDYHVRMAY